MFVSLILHVLQSELERKKKMERREIAELHEEIATMQTLYQYRTYSVDSSEDSDVEEEHQQVQPNYYYLKLIFNRDINSYQTFCLLKYIKNMLSIYRFL